MASLESFELLYQLKIIIYYRSIKLMMNIDEKLVKRLVSQQFPKWANLSIQPVAQSGWDNRTFHLGDDMSIRMPCAEQYSPQILKEFKWLPYLSEQVSIEITTPIALGMPSDDYPFHWSINNWIHGETTSYHTVSNLNALAIGLGKFLVEFEQVDASKGPIAGKHNFYRGGSLSIYNEEMLVGLSNVADLDRRDMIKEIWIKSLSSRWQQAPVWVHGDLACGNILIQNGQLKAIIDFGQLAVGDPACDLVMAWNFFDEGSRKIFRDMIQVDNHTWVRAMGWALWKTVCCPIKGTDIAKIVDEICRDYQSNFKS